VALAFAVLGLGDASLRLASRVVPSGLERAIAAATFAAAAAVLSALALGLVSLGGDTYALLAATAVLFAAARIYLPTPAVSPLDELGRWWSARSLLGRLSAWALAGGFAAFVVWLLRHPSIGFDGSMYHYPEVAGWIVNGRPGSILYVHYDLPFGNYPLTDEVALTWLTGIARSWVPLYLWNPTMLVLLGAAAWATLRNLEVPRPAALLACAGLVVNPMMVHQLNEPHNDLPMLAWVACTAAFCSGARRRPLLLAPAIVAAGLALGTKPTPVVVVIGALAGGLLLARGEVRPLLGWLGVAAAVAAAIGGVWYVRNLFEHGSPVWPFTETSWGDPRPPFLHLVKTRFIDRPGATLDGRLGDYTNELGGAWLMLAGALLALAGALVARGLPRGVRRALIYVGVTSVLAFGFWSLAPGTGLPTTPRLFEPRGWPISTLRYLLPTMFAATVTVALAARVRGPVRALTLALLAVGLGWSIAADARIGFPITPAPRVLLGGALIGLAAGLILQVARPPVRIRGALAALGAATVIGVVMAPVSNGMVERHAGVRDSTALGREVITWFERQPDLDGGHQRIAFIGRSLEGPLAGEHFTHPLQLIDRTASCKQVREIADRSYTVVSPPNFLVRFVGILPYRIDRCLAGRKPVFRSPPFTVYPPR
jgi:hypothetical protein